VELPVHNACAHKETKLTWERFVDICLKISFSAPLENVLWKPDATFIDNATLFWLKVIFFHFIPAVFADSALRLLGRKPR
jgi:fatty acyl-CoA reductase